MDPFIGKRLSELSRDDLQRLVDDSVPEGLHLEYKRDLTLDAKDVKKEFLRDLTAFANAEGGLLLYGVDEERDGEGKPTGTPKSIPGVSIPNFDTVKLKIENLLRDGIDERLPAGYEIYAIEIEATLCVVGIRIPTSIRSPHMVVLGGERRFFVRTNGGKQDMSTAQMRDSVLKSDSIESRVRAFVEQRIAKARENLRDTPCWFLHIVPLMRRPTAIDVVDEEVVEQLNPVTRCLGNRSGHCLEGYRGYWLRQPTVVSQSIVFRDGSVEFMDQETVNLRGEKLFPYSEFHQEVRGCLDATLTLYRTGLLTPPFAVALAIVNLGGFKLPENRLTMMAPTLTAAPYDDILPDPIVIHDPQEDPEQVLRPLLDVVWNAFGVRHCPAYDDDGNVIGYER